MCCDEDLLLPAHRQVCKSGYEMILKTGMEMSVWLIQKQHVDRWVESKSEHAQPLEEPTTLHHQGAWPIVGVTLELEPVD